MAKDLEGTTAEAEGDGGRGQELWGPLLTCHPPKTEGGQMEAGTYRLRGDTRLYIFTRMKGA